MGRTVLIMTAGVLATLLLIKWAVDVSFAGAAANVLADLAVVGMITVFARSWLLRLRRSSFSAELRQSQREARLTVDAWIVAQREKRDQYSHLLGGSGRTGSPSVSYRESRAGALRVLPSLEDAASGDELRQAVHRVSAAEQAAKAQRVRLHNVLDPIFREWITAIGGVEDAAFQRKLPSQRGLPGWQPEDIRQEEVGVVGARGLRPLVVEYLDNEDKVREELLRLRELLVRGVDIPKAAEEKIPGLLPRKLERIALAVGIAAVLIWLTDAVVHVVVDDGDPGEFSSDVSNNLLCALAVVAASTAIGAYIKYVTKRQQAVEANRPLKELVAALSRAQKVLTDVEKGDSRRFFVTSNGDIERDAIEHWVNAQSAEELNEQLDLIRVHLDELERIRPDQPLTRFEDQLSDYIRRFAPDTGVVRVPEGELVAASHLMEDMQLRLTKLFPDADVPGKPAPELVRS